MGISVIIFTDRSVSMVFSMIPTMTGNIIDVLKCILNGKRILYFRPDWGFPAEVHRWFKPLSGSLAGPV